MIGDYLVVALVFGIVALFVAVIHRFWLRDAFREEAHQSARAKSKGTCGTSTSATSAPRQSHGSSQTEASGRS